MTEVDFMSNAMSMEPIEIMKLFITGKLRSDDEDRTFDFLIQYIAQNQDIAMPYASQLLNFIRYWRLSDQKIL